MRVSQAWGAVILSCLACAGEDDTSRVELAPYMDYCFGVDSVHPCAVTEDGRTYSFIEGFEFEWGYHTVVTMQTRHIANPPQDGSSLEYRAIDVESRRPVQPGTRFELELITTLGSENFSRIVAGDCARGFDLFPGFSEVKPFSFETSAACESFEQLIATEVPLELNFEFDTTEAPLTLVAFE